MNAMEQASERPSALSEHALAELRLGSRLSGSNEWRGWVCACGTVGGGYRFPSDTACVNEWAEHLLAQNDPGGTPRWDREAELGMLAWARLEPDEASE